MGCLSSQRLSVYMSTSSNSSIRVLRAPWLILRCVVNVSLCVCCSVSATHTRSKPKHCNDSWLHGQIKTVFPFLPPTYFLQISGYWDNGPQRKGTSSGKSKSQRNLSLREFTELWLVRPPCSMRLWVNTPAKQLILKVSEMERMGCHRSGGQLLYLGLALSCLCLHQSQCPVTKSCEPFGIH